MSAKTIRDTGEKLSQVGKELYAKGSVKGNSGNISARVPDGNKFMMKPSGACLGKLMPREIVIVDLGGNKIRGKREVSAETPMHVAIYKARRDEAAVHSHAPTATAFWHSKRRYFGIGNRILHATPKWEYQLFLSSSQVKRRLPKKFRSGLRIIAEDDK